MAALHLNTFGLKISVNQCSAGGVVELCSALPFSRLQKFAALSLLAAPAGIPSTGGASLHNNLSLEAFACLSGVQKQEALAIEPTPLALYYASGMKSGKLGTASSMDAHKTSPATSSQPQPTEKKKTIVVRSRFPMFSAPAVSQASYIIRLLGKLESTGPHDLTPGACP